MDGRTGYYRSTGRMRLKKLPWGNWLYPRMSRGLNHRTSFLSACQTLLPRKAFANDPQSRGDCQWGHCCPEAPKPPTGELKSFLPGKCRVVAGYTKHIPELQSQFQHPSQIQQYPLLQHRHGHSTLALCSSLGALSAMRTLMQAWTRMKQSDQFHPIPFLSF